MKNRVKQDPAFVDQLKNRWEYLRASTLSEYFILDKIDAYTAVLKDSGALNNNFQLWNVIGEYVWPNNFVGTSYDDDVEYLKEWIRKRLFWMDGAIQNL